MSTPALILIEHGETRVYLYRHHDGFLHDTGEALVKYIRAHSYYRDSSAQSWGPDANELLVAMIGETYTDGRRVYDVMANTNCGAVFFYHVNIPREDGAPFTIGWAKRGRDEAHVSRVTDRLSLEKFVTAVNLDIHAINRHREQLRQAHPGEAFYEEHCEPQLPLPVVFAPKKPEWLLIQEAHEAARHEPNAALFNTDVALWIAKRDGFLRVTDDGSVIQSGEVLGRFASRADAEDTLRRAGWTISVSTTRDNQPLWVR